ncbi:DKNYY domain-containing protein [Motilimonas cestriensis]|uniref:DKNYY domain-containing protein n=1 Tax=Motilimonas cestriensis TaxID=2742685 RepID=UPI003DA4AE6E
MLTTFQILTALALLFWPMMWIGSVMMFGGPGATDNPNTVYSTVALLLYPCVLFLLYGLMGWPLFFIPSKYLMIIGIPLNLLLVYASYGSLVSNTLRGISNSGYSVVEQNVYYSGKLIPDALAESFSIFDNEPSYRSSQYARDAERVYYHGQPLPEADATSFKLLFADNDDYWADKNQVFYHATPLNLTPSKTRVFHQDSHATYLTDGERLYCESMLVAGADLASFTVLFGPVAKDKHHIYYEDAIILPEADITSFTLYDNEQYYAFDKNSVYDLIADNSQEITDSDPASFEFLGRGYMKDKHRVYLSQQYAPTIVLADVDRESLVVTDYDDKTGSDAYDKHGYLLNGQRLNAD